MRRLVGKHGQQTEWSYGRHGVVLIVVLVLVMMVALAGFGFLSGMSTEYEAARLNGSMRQAQQTMASAESTLLWLAGLSTQQRNLMGGLDQNPALLRARLVEPVTALSAASGGSTGPLQPGSLPGSEPDAGSDTGLDSAQLLTDDRWRFSVVSLDIPQDQNPVLRFGMTDESAKVHLASLLRWELAAPGAGRTSLMQLPGMTEAIADCILDWIDADDQAREFGAEAEYYQTLDRPYRPANALPQRISELLFVKGVTRSLLLGGSPNASEPGSPSSDAATTSMSASGGLADSSPPLLHGWQEVLTVNAAERNQRGSGEPRISLNSGTLAEVEQQLSGAVPPEMIRYIQLARTYSVRPGDETAVRGVDPMSAPFSAAATPVYSVSSLAELIDSTVAVTTPSGTIVVQSPLSTEAPTFAELSAALSDLTTTSPEQLIVGRIRLATASETALRMIPGLTPEQVSQIVTQRDSLDAAEQTSLVWPLSRGILDGPTFRRVFPELTTGGDVFQAEIIVHRAIGGPLLRRKAMIDAASSPARRVHWQDLTDQPLPYSTNILLPRN
jgi:hypothetical protein